MPRIIFDTLTADVTATSAVATINALADGSATGVGQNYLNTAGDLYYNMYIDIAADAGATPWTVGDPIAELYAIGGEATFLPAAAGLLRAEHLVATITAATTGASAEYIISGLPLSPHTLMFDIKNISGAAIDILHTTWRIHPYSLKTV